MISGGIYDLWHMVWECEIEVEHHSWHFVLVRPDYQEYWLESDERVVFSCFGAYQNKLGFVRVQF